MALTIPKNIQLDLSKTGSQASFIARKGDDSVYVARISLIDRGTVIAIPDTCTALLHGIKPDGYPLYTDATINGGRVIAEFPEQAFTSVGTVQFEVNVTGADGEALYSPKFDVLVEDVVTEGSTESTADFSALQTALILARRGIVIQGSPYATIELLKADITDPRIGDIYEVGTTIPYDKWRWSGNTATGDDGWIPEGTMSGKSAFQLAVDGGYTGTLEQWIESLRGNDGHGVPSGGSVNQTLVKSGAEDFATSWGNAMLQYAAMPTATVSNLGQIAQFTGSTGDGYTNGHIYTCVSSGGETPTYSWTEIVYGDPNSVSYNAQTGKTSAEKAQARVNIGAAASNPNLLHNGGWRSPVNQRAHTGAVSNAYCIDRWIGNGSVTPSAGNHVTLANGTTMIQRMEILPAKLLSKTVTTSIEIDGVTQSATLTFPPSVYDAAVSLALTGVTVEVGYLDIGMGNTTLLEGLASQVIPYIKLTATAAINVQRVKLELGAVVTEFEPRTYADELELCKRYYRHALCFSGYANTGNVLGIGHSLTPAMRINPTVSMYNTELSPYGGATINVDGVALVATDGDILYAYCSTSSPFTAGKYYTMFVNADAEL